MRAWVRLDVPLVVALEGTVAGEGGECRGFERRGLSRVLSSIEVGEEVDKGVIGRGLSGEGVRETGSSRGGFDLSPRNVPSMIMLEFGRESMRVSTEKVDKELIRSMGGGMSCTVASSEAGREEACGRSGERGGRGGDFEGCNSSWSGRWEDAVCTRGERGRADGRTSRPCIREGILGAPRCVGKCGSSTGTGTGILDDFLEKLVMMTGRQNAFSFQRRNLCGCARKRASLPQI